MTRPQSRLLHVGRRWGSALVTTRVNFGGLGVKRSRFVVVAGDVSVVGVALQTDAQTVEVSERSDFIRQLVLRPPSVDLSQMITEWNLENNNTGGG